MLCHSSNADWPRPSIGLGRHQAGQLPIVINRRPTDLVGQYHTPYHAVSLVLGAIYHWCLVCTTSPAHNIALCHTFGPKLVHASGGGRGGGPGQHSGLAAMGIAPQGREGVTALRQRTVSVTPPARLPAGSEERWARASGPEARYPSLSRASQSRV